MLEATSAAAETVREVAVIIPAHNEANRLHETVLRLARYFGERATLLVVANGCTDDTADIVRQLARDHRTVELLEIPHQIGKGGAVRAGLTLGNEPHVAFVDADGSTAADQLDILLKTCVDGKLSGTIGSRWMRGSRIARKQPFQRRLASRAFNSITRVVLGLNFTDTQCGAKVFERAAVDHVLDKLEIANFAFDVDILLALKKVGKPVIEIPISWEDVAEYSKVRLARSGSEMLWSLTRLFVRESIFSRIPFIDALGLSKTIPVRCGLDILFLIPREHSVGPGLIALTKRLRNRGHVVRLVRMKNIISIIRMGVWYARTGHRRSDVIVHALGYLGSRLLSLSAKPKFSLVHLEREAEDTAVYCDRFVEDVIHATHSSLYLRRHDDVWTLAAQRLETSRIDRV